MYASIIICELGSVRVRNVCTVGVMVIGAIATALDDAAHELALSHRGGEPILDAFAKGHVFEAIVVAHDLVGARHLGVPLLAGLLGPVLGVASVVKVVQMVVGHIEKILEWLVACFFFTEKVLGV